MQHPHIHFVTGKLAAPSLREVVAQLQQRITFEATIEVLPITVAALMTTEWIAQHLQDPGRANVILLPGYCLGDLTPVQMRFPDVRVERGPRDLLALPEYFGQAPDRSGYGAYAIEIVAEINHASRLSLADLIQHAEQLVRDGADIIDLGCTPGSTWTQIGDAVKALRDRGCRVSVDSFDPVEVVAAVRSGAELVLSVNSTNRHFASDWGCEVVAIPDTPSDWEGFLGTIDYLQTRQIPCRLDPILEPIGCGFAASLQRYLRTRQEFPDHAMLMGIGNLTELTEVDSAGLNLLLLGICEDLNINRVLTTQVIPWAQSSVRECDLARRLVHFAVQRGVVPKHLDAGLVVLRDARLYEQGSGRLDALAQQLRDHNYRIFAEGNQIHLVSRQLHLADHDPFTLFAQLMATAPKNIDASHAFYLGFEMAKAATALTLGKQYRQDQALDWGFLTEPEPHRRRHSSS